MKHVSHTPHRKASTLIKRTRRSFNQLKNHPGPAIKILGVGAGILSGIYLLSQFRKH